MQAQNRHLDYLTDLSIEWANSLFVLLFENEAGRRRHTGYYLPTVEIKDYNVLIDGRNFFSQPIRNDIKTYENIMKTAFYLGDHYTTGCLLSYLYFKGNWNDFDRFK